MPTCPVIIKGQVSGQGLPNLWTLETLGEGREEEAGVSREEQCHMP